MLVGSIEYFLRSEETVVRAREYMSSEHVVVSDCIVPNRCPFFAPHILVLTFSVIAEAHLGLTKTNGVFPLTDSIEFFEFFLVDALEIFPVSQLQLGSRPCSGSISTTSTNL